jgi:hypothetical protein
MYNAQYRRGRFRPTVGVDFFVESRLRPVFIRAAEGFDEQAGQGRRERGVLRTRATEDADRSPTKMRSAIVQRRSADTSALPTYLAPLPGVRRTSQPSYLSGGGVRRISQRGETQDRSRGFSRGRSLCSSPPPPIAPRPHLPTGVAAHPFCLTAVVCCDRTPGASVRRFGVLASARPSRAADRGGRALNQLARKRYWRGG